MLMHPGWPLSFGLLFVPAGLDGFAGTIRALLFSQFLGSGLAAQSRKLGHCKRPFVHVENCNTCLHVCQELYLLLSQ